MAHRLLSGAAIAALMLAGTAASAGDRGHARGYHHNGWDNGRSSWDRGHSRHHNDNGDDAALLIGGAILGLAVGAALADGHDSGPSYNSYDPGYAYDPGYYPEPSYSYAPPPPSYSYAPPPPPPRAAAPSYATAPCGQVRSGRTAAGAVIGGVVGGLLGNGVAASKNRDEGAAVGVALGSVIGGSIGNSSADCNASAGYYQAGYAPSAPLYGGRMTDTPNYYPGAGASSGYGQDYGYDQGYDDGYAPSPEDQLYGGPSGSNAPAAEECENVTRVTTLPDGTEIHEPALACRQANYGSWSVQ